MRGGHAELLPHKRSSPTLRGVRLLSSADSLSELLPIPRDPPRPARAAGRPASGRARHWNPPRPAEPPRYSAPLNSSASGATCLLCNRTQSLIGRCPDSSHDLDTQQLEVPHIPGHDALGARLQRAPGDQRVVNCPSADAIGGRLPNRLHHDLPIQRDQTQSAMNTLQERHRPVRGHTVRRRQPRKRRIDLRQAMGGTARLIPAATLKQTKTVQMVLMVRHEHWNQHRRIEEVLHLRTAQQREFTFPPHHIQRLIDNGRPERPARPQHWHAAFILQRKRRRSIGRESVLRVFLGSARAAAGGFKQVRDNRNSAAGRESVLRVFLGSAKAAAGGPKQVRDNRNSAAGSESVLRVFLRRPLERT